MTHSSTSNSNKKPLLDRWFICVAVCATLSVFVGLGLKSVWLQVYEPVHEDHYQTLAFEALSPETEILLLGTSHMRSGFNPEWTDLSIVSLNHPAMDYELMELLLRQHIDQLPGLEAVVIELDSFALECDTLGFVGDTASLDRMGLSPLTYPCSLQRRVKLFARRLAPFRRPELVPTAILDRFWETPKLQAPGYHEINREMVTPGEGRADFHMRTFDRFPGRHAPNREAFLDMVRLLKERSIRCILLRMPHDPEYWDHMDQDHIRNLNGLSEDALAMGNVTVLDLDDPNQPEFTLETEDFLDGDHLNASGARKLSPVLGARLEAMLR